MARPRKLQFAPEPDEPEQTSQQAQEQPNPLIITMSQLLAMSHDEREAFRRKNGTVTEDHPKS